MEFSWPIQKEALVRCTSFVVALALSLVVSAVADAGTNVQRRRGIGGTWETIETNHDWIAEPVLEIDLDTPNLAADTWYFRVYNDSGVGDIKHIRFINSSSPRNMVLFIATPSPLSELLGAGTTMPAGCARFGGVSLPTIGVVTAQISVSQDLVSFYSSSHGVNVDRLFRLDVGGSISDTVHQYDRTDTHLPMGPVLCGTLNSAISADRGIISDVRARNGVTTSGSIKAFDTAVGTGGIGEVIVGSSTTSADMEGWIRSEHGSIDSITVYGDVVGRIHAENKAIGNLTVHGALRSPDFSTNYPIRCADGINRLVAESISANITAATVNDTGIDRGLGLVGLIKTTNGSISKNIALKGLVTPAGGGESGIIVNGSFTNTANILFLSGAPHPKAIAIRDSFAGQIRFDDSSALDMQIVANAGNTGGSWTTGSVILDRDAVFPQTPITISTTETNLLYQGPFYDATPAMLGGGSVGVVPFALHDYACVPTNPPLNGAPGEVTMTVDQQVVLEFYGPVRAENNSNRPFHVWFLIPGTEDDWYEATDWFTGITSGRKLILTRYACIPKGLYLVEQALPGMNRLMCDVPGFPGTSAPVADFGYLFKVIGSGADCPCYYVPWECSQCAADFDGNGGVDGGDISAFLLNFEAGCACADVDHNGGVEGGDLAVFFDLFEAGGC